MTSGELVRRARRKSQKNAAEQIVPDNEEDLVAETALLLVLEVEDSVSGVILGETSDELLVGGSLGGSLLDNNLGVVGVNGENNVAVGLAELELLELLHARVRDLDARGLVAECEHRYQRRARAAERAAEGHGRAPCWLLEDPKTNE